MGSAEASSSTKMVHGSVRSNKAFQHSSSDGAAEKERDDEDEEEMDSALWSWLPGDLLVSVLARLPVDGLARAHAVCREWRALAQTRLSPGPSPNAWFIFLRKHRPLAGAMRLDCYDTHSNRWREFRFDHLPQLQRVVAAAGSLLLCVGTVRVGRSGGGSPSYHFLDMVVCNPLRPGTWDRIPDRRGSLVPHVGMTADPHSGAYRVVLASSEKTEVFDSRTRRWRLSGSILAQLRDGDVVASPVEYRGRLLFLAGQGRVLVYDPERDRCTSFDNLSSRDDPFRFGYLENCGGRLLMARISVSLPAEEEEEDDRRRGLRFERNFHLRVCQYVHAAEDLAAGAWSELTGIPLLRLESAPRVDSADGARFLAAARGGGVNDLVCFTMGMTRGKLDWTNCVQGRAIFLYSLSQKAWCFAGERPDWTHDGVICMRSLQFQPSLRASLLR